jgi:hypothetical protein
MAGGIDAIWGTRRIITTERIDAAGSAYRGNDHAGLDRAPARHSRREPPVSLARRCLFRPCHRSTVERDRHPSAKAGRFLKCQKDSVSPCLQHRFSRGARWRTPVDNTVLKLWNESRTNRARIADSRLNGFVHGNISWQGRLIPQYRVTVGNRPAASNSEKDQAHCPAFECGAMASRPGTFCLWRPITASWR